MTTATAIDATEELDPVTQDMVIGQLEQLELFHWFVRAHLEPPAAPSARPASRASSRRPTPRHAPERRPATSRARRGHSAQAMAPGNA